jgi:hypothetical protein
MTNVALRWLIGEHYVPFCGHIHMNIFETIEDLLNISQFRRLKCFKLCRAIPCYRHTIFLDLQVVLLKKFSNLI